MLRTVNNIVNSAQPLIYVITTFYEFIIVDEY